MLKLLILLVVIAFGKSGFCQQILNGDFELNTAVTDQINLPNIQYNSLMSNSVAFGSLGNMDITTSNTYCGLAQHGNWYVAITGGGTDAISLELSHSLIQGDTYTISYYDRLCRPSSITDNPVQIGVSETDNNFGSVIYTAPNPTIGWNLRKFTFKAPVSGRFITVRVQGGDSFDTWCHIDNFSIECSLSVDLGNDTTVCDGQNLTLDAFIPGANYLWRNNSTASSIQVSTAGAYWVTASKNNCNASDTILVNFEKCYGFPYVPGAFSPNDDGRNDLFKVTGHSGEMLLKIYNRWGTLVFQSALTGNGWDGKYKGKPQPPGAYIYFLRYKNLQQVWKELKGTFLLVR